MVIFIEHVRRDGMWLILVYDTDDMTLEMVDKRSAVRSGVPIVGHNVSNSGSSWFSPDAYKRVSYQAVCGGIIFIKNGYFRYVLYTSDNMRYDLEVDTAEDIWYVVVNGVPCTEKYDRMPVLMYVAGSGLVSCIGETIDIIELHGGINYSFVRARKELLLGG